MAPGDDETTETTTTDADDTTYEGAEGDGGIYVGGLPMGNDAD